MKHHSAMNKSLILAVLLLPPLFLPAHAEEALEGKAVETMDSGGYTYIKLDDGKSLSWVAVPPMKVQVGQKLRLRSGMELRNFKSNSLKRSFERIIFSEGPFVKSAAKGGPAKSAGALPPGHPPLDKAAPAGGGAPKLGAEPSAITEKAQGKDAYTVAQLHAQRLELAGRRVLVRGKIVKFSRQIMGMNWAHLQDGSGDPKAGTHDLTVTTAEEAKLGETVTASGWVLKDKDFGAGYKYAVLLEKAALERR